MQSEAASRFVNIRFSGTETFDNSFPLIKVMMYLGGKGMLVSILLLVGSCLSCRGVGDLGIKTVADYVRIFE
jgi:hypothetical protein